MVDPREDQNEYIVCPECQGNGKNSLGFPCSYCGQMGTGVFFFGRFFYWGTQLGKAVIELKHIRDKAQMIINMTAFAIGFLGLLSLAYWVYLSSSEFETVEALAFWRTKSIFIFLFWVSLLSDLFVYYRMSEQSRKRHQIKALTYSRKKKPQIIPDNWEGLVSTKSKLKVDVVKGYDVKTEKLVEEAFLLADKMGHAEVLPIHLFFAVLADQEIAAIFSRLKVDLKSLAEKIKTYVERVPESREKTILSRSVKEVLIEAYLDAQRLGQSKVSAKNLLIPCLKKDKLLEDMLYDLEIDIEKIFNVILWFVINEKQVESYRQYRKMARFKPGNNMDRAYTAVATPTLNQFAYDITSAAKQGRLEYCVAREKDIEKIWQNIESGAHGVILTGPIGVGKGTVVDGIAQLMVKEDVPPVFQDKRLVELDAARLISGVTPAQAEGRMFAVIDEIVRSGNIVLFIKNIEKMIGITSGEEESLDLSEVLSQAIERGQIYCLASSTNRNYSNYIEHRSLGNSLSRVEIKEPEGNQAIQIVESKIGALEGKYKIYFSYDAIEEAIRLTQKYIHDKYLPEKAIKVLELAATKRLKTKGEQSIVGKDEVAEVISEKTGIPSSKVSESESQKLLNMEEQIHARMIGQEEAVKMVASSLRRARAELREGKRPIVNLLFLGPTGVGKTELAKTVSELYFGNEDYMIRVDMSEYQHPDSVKKMIGSPVSKGYLTELVRQSPFSLILLDEVEKAHPDILNLFLQVMDDGRLTDGQGNTIDFTNSIVIATSNAGALFIQEQIFAGVSHESIKTELINNHLNKIMRPELINRFDGVIVFEPLSQENVVEIARLMIEKTKKMLLDKGIEFRVEEEGLRVLAQEGYDPKFGARPLRRVLQDQIDNQIANLVLAGDLNRRDTLIVGENAELRIEKAKKI